LVDTCVAAGEAEAETKSEPDWTVIVLIESVVDGRDTYVPEF
jgi:hypothetical protein